MADWRWPRERLEHGTWRLQAAAGGRALTWREVLDHWRQDPAFADAFTETLAAMPWRVFRWETPPLTAADRDTTFECVVVDSPGLPTTPDPAPFAEHLRRANSRPVVSFPNLGGDAVLVVPCQLVDPTAYTHLASFVRQAPRAQQRALWREVARAMEDRLDRQPVWLSTAGGGVAWLHVRLDDRPKYYAHTAYRRVPAA